MRDEIINWIVSVGGVIDTGDNHFGGDPNWIGRSELDLKIQQRPGELSTLIDTFIQKKAAGEKLEYYAEIGACSGGTTYALNHFLEFKETLVIDDNSHEYSSRNNFQRQKNLQKFRVSEIIGDSKNPSIISEAHKISENIKFDILFIDGDHSYEGVKNDTINYESIVRPGGYIVYHDSAHMVCIKDWVNEVLIDKEKYKLVLNIAEKDPYTDFYSDGIGLTIIKKMK